jgi:hypothetical protein
VTDPEQAWPVPDQDVPLRRVLIATLSEEAIAVWSSWRLRRIAPGGKFEAVM